MRSHLIALAALLALNGCGATFGPQTTVPTSPNAPTSPLADAHGRPKITLSSASAGQGGTATITATLQTGGAKIAGTQNDIVFDPKSVAIVRKANGKPDCRANTALGKEGTAFNFVPAKCAPGSCDTVRALVLSLSNVDPIADGSVLYSCTVEVVPGASAGAKPLKLSRVGFSDPGGKVVNGVGVDGSVTVGR